MQVHPDFFADRVAERKQNEQSFGVLQVRGGACLFTCRHVINALGVS
jgi:hypothetical protein